MECKVCRREVFFESQKSGVCNDCYADLDYDGVLADLSPQIPDHESDNGCDDDDFNDK